MGTFLGDFGGYKANYGYTNKKSTAAKKGSMGSTISAIKGAAGAANRFVNAYGNALGGALKSAISAAAPAIAAGASGSRGGGSRGGGGSVQVVDSGGYSGGVSDLSDYLRQQQAAQTEAALAALKGAYDKNVLLYDAQRGKLPALYNAQRNQLASDVAQSRRAYDERALASGLNTGTAGQADLARSSVMNQGMADIGQAEADALAEIDLARSQLQAEYENAIAQQKAQDGAALLERLYEEAVRQDNARMNAASTPSYRTVVRTSGTSGTSGTSLADRLAAMAGTGGSSGSSYKNTTAYKRAVSYAKAGAQSRRTANLLNGFVKSGQITSSQAQKIMDELY